MTKIDTSGWKPFVVGELFPSMVKPPVLHARQVVETDEGIPYVVRTKFNNGIKCRVHPVSDVIPSPAGVITWGAENAAFFYQAEEFLSGRDIYYVDTRPYSATTCMFLAACLQTVVHKYPYNYGLFPDLLKEEQIRLPVDAAGEPNWAYMDEYMSAVMRESEASLESLRQADERKQMFEISNWKEFPIGGEHGLFDVVKGSRLTKAAMREGTINFISASSFNNGIAAHIANTEHVHPGNTLTVSYNGSDIGRTFYQKEPFWASDDVNVLYPRFELNERIALFLAPLIKAAGGSHVYKNKWLQTDMMNTMIPLPITEGGNPDWDYMDEYMCALLERTDNNLVELQTVI